MMANAASLWLGPGYFWTAWEIHERISAVAVLLEPACS